MAKGSITAPTDPDQKRRNDISKLHGKSNRTPAEMTQYVQLLEAEITALTDKLSSTELK
jgi:hypothetical protein